MEKAWSPIIPLESHSVSTELMFFLRSHFLKNPPPNSFHHKVFETICHSNHNGVDVCRVSSGALFTPHVTMLVMSLLYASLSLFLSCQFG